MRGEVGEMSSSGPSEVRPSIKYGQSVKVYDPRGTPRSRRSPAGENQASWPEFGMFGVNVKEEPMDDARNDSGVTSGSDCPSASPGSDRSDSHPSTSPSNNVYPFPRAAAESLRPYNHWFPQSSQPPTASQPASDHQHVPQNSDRNSVSPKNELGTDDNSNEFDDDGIRVPKINSHGKVKIHKCKQCEFFAYTKLEFWEHSRVHIKGDKILKCTKCPFVTEYKHHLEYHLLNHAGSKPFKCEHCDYSCVNKSMLNSHLKSHSKVYQYRCANCHYETKYCHSLKLHLRKYGHKPAMVLNPDGSPNPLPIIDVYGTRRGPKVKKNSESSNGLPLSNSSPQMEAQPPQIPFNPLINPLLNQNAMLPFPLPLLPAFPGALHNQEMMMSFQNLFRERLEELAKQNPVRPEPQPQENGALDLTNKSSHSSENGESDEEDAMTTAFENVEVVVNKSADGETTLTPEAAKEAEAEAKNNNKYDFSCQYCGISFGDEVLYRIHMGYHGYSNPFTCNMCGEECENKPLQWLKDTSNTVQILNLAKMTDIM